MKIPKLYVVLLLSAAALSSDLKAISACTSPAAGNDRNFVLIAVRNASAGTDCSALTTQIRPAVGTDLTNGTFDTGFIVASPPLGYATRTIDPSVDTCSLLDNGTPDQDDFVAGNQTYHGHIMVLVNNQEALPARMVPAAYIKGNLPAKGSKWSKMYPLNAVGAVSSSKVCQLVDATTGVAGYFCRYCTSKAIGNEN